MTQNALLIVFFLFSDIRLFRASESNWSITLRWIFVFKSKQNQVNQVNTKSFCNPYINTFGQTNDPPSTLSVSLLSIKKNIFNFGQNRMTRSFCIFERLN